jgi:HK97 family phage portal protein
VSRWRREKTEDRALSVETGFFPSVMLRPTASGESVTVRSALQVPEVWSCCRVLADSAASLPLRLYRSTTGGQRVEVRSGQTFELLRNPAPTVTGGNLISTIVLRLVLNGEAWLAKYRGPDGQIDQLGVIPNERVYWQIRDGQPLYTITTLAGTVQEAGPRDLVHIRAMSLDGYRGLSPVQECAEAIGICLAMQQHAARFFQNDARPSGLLRVPAGPQADEQVENLRRAWEARHTGTAGAHRIAVMSGEVGFDAISLDPDASQFSQQREAAVRAICRAFRVPPYLIAASDGASMTYSNTETQNQAFIDHSLRPTLTVIEQGLTADPDLCMGSLSAEFDFTSLLRGDHVSRAAFYASGIAAGWLRPEEARVMEGLPALPPDRMPRPDLAALSKLAPPPQEVPA